MYNVYTPLLAAVKEGYIGESESSSAVAAILQQPIAKTTTGTDDKLLGRAAVLSRSQDVRVKLRRPFTYKVPSNRV